MSEKIARFITKVTNPITTGLFSSFLIIQKTNLTAQNKFLWFLVILILGFLPAFLYLYWQINRGKIIDWYLNTRADRYVLLLLSTFSSLAVFLAAFIFNTDKLIVSFTLTGFILNAAIYAITFFWKISVHTAAAAILALVLIFIYSSFFILTFFLVFLVGWARITLRRHTVAEAIGGVLLSTIVFLLIFKVFRLI